jgi:hypothetical protein
MKALYNEAVSQLEGKKESQDKQAAESGRLRGEVANLQLKIMDANDTRFALAVEQVKVVAPGLDVSKLSPQLEVMGGQLVPCEPFVNPGDAPA